MKVEGKLEYEMFINENGGHSIKYDPIIENELVGLWVAANVITESLKSSKEAKKRAEGSKKRAIETNISHLSKSLHSIEKLLASLLNGYEGYKASVQAQVDKLKEIAAKSAELSIQDGKEIPADENLTSL